LLVAAKPKVSVTCTPKVKLLAASGVPVIAPVADIFKPGGSVPDTIDNVRVPGPPIALTEAEYGVPTVVAARVGEPVISGVIPETVESTVPLAERYWIV
jgi:hypothetical protein